MTKLAAARERRASMILRRRLANSSAYRITDRMSDGKGGGDRKRNPPIAIRQKMPSATRTERGREIEKRETWSTRIIPSKRRDEETMPANKTIFCPLESIHFSPYIPEAEKTMGLTIRTSKSMKDRESRKSKICFEPKRSQKPARRLERIRRMS